MRKRSGFTLVELLVTIMIVVVLASLIMPLIKKLQTSTKTAVCVNNLRQLSAGMLLYCADHDGRFPDSTNYPTNSDPINNSNAIWYLLLNGAGAPFWPSTVYVAHEGWASGKGVYFCPANPTDTSGGSAGWTTYAYNSNLPGARLATITGKIALLMDSFNPDSNNTDYGNSGARYSSAWRHSHGLHHGGQNVAFVDGHVEWVNVEPHPSKSMEAGSDCVDMKAKWFWPLH